MHTPQRIVLSPDQFGGKEEERKKDKRRDKGQLYIERERSRSRWRKFRRQRKEEGMKESKWEEGERGKGVKEAVMTVTIGATMPSQGISLSLFSLSREEGMEKGGGRERWREREKQEDSGRAKSGIPTFIFCIYLYASDEVI